jgi:hypothetical protein
MPQPNSASNTWNVDRTTALYERPALEPQDVATFNTVKGDIESSFASGQVVKFLESLTRSGLRIREFESVASAGKLGLQTAPLYAKLPPGDQGQIREFYLAQLEQVDPALRKKFFKLYAYY